MQNEVSTVKGFKDPPSYQQGSKYPWVIDLKPLDNFQLWLKYSDGKEGTIDLSDVAHTELFSDWQQPGVFDAVKIGEYGEVYWTPDANLCADSLYLDIVAQESPNG